MTKWTLKPLLLILVALSNIHAHPFTQPGRDNIRDRQRQNRANAIPSNSLVSIDELAGAAYESPNVSSYILTKPS